MTLQELCEMQHRALMVRGCLCTWDRPYEPRELVQQCLRCKCKDEFEKLQQFEIPTETL